MRRPSVFAAGLLAAASLLLRTATGCNTSNGSTGSPDAGEDVTEDVTQDTAVDAADYSDASRLPCNGGCLCFAADACPVGCYPSVTEEPDGARAQPFCSNGITQCVPGGFSWSFGETKTCPGLNPPGSRTALPDYPVTYLDGGPDGAFCCDLEREYALIGDATGDTGGDTGGTRDAASGGPCTATSDCNPGEQCLFPIGDCSAKGQCLSLASLGAQCAHEVAYCGCNGTTVEGLCGPPYAYGPTPSADAASRCGHADAGDVGGE